MMKTPVTKLGVRGWFDVVLRRKGTVIRTMRVDNGATYVGLSTMLNATFNGGSGFSNLYIGLVSFLDAINTPTAVPTIGDTMASNGWLDFEFENYAQATRPEAVFTSTTSGKITAAAVTFDMTDGGNLQGFFVVDNNTKGGTTGDLWASAMRTFVTEGKSIISDGSEFSNDFTVLNGDNLQVSYSVSLTPVDS